MLRCYYCEHFVSNALVYCTSWWPQSLPIRCWNKRLLVDEKAREPPETRWSTRDHRSSAAAGPGQLCHHLTGGWRQHFLSGWGCLISVLSIFLFQSLLTCWVVLRFLSVLDCLMEGDGLLLVVVGVKADACWINKWGSTVRWRTAGRLF